MPVSIIQFVLLSLAFSMIIDLDRPRTGLVEVDQQPMFRAVAAIRTAEASAATELDRAAQISRPARGFAR